MKKRREVKRVPYAKAEDKIRTGDLLSFHPRCKWYQPWGWFTWLIALTNQYRICHSAMACWWDNNLLLVQMTSSPSRIILLSDVVKQWPGKIIVSRPNGQFQEDYATSVMVRITEKSYGWVRLFLLGLSHTFTGGLLWPNPIDDDTAVSDLPPVCSESYSRAMRLAGFDPVEGRPDSKTEPHHLYESPKLKPLFVLV
jgi:hypothetical protein